MMDFLSRLRLHIGYYRLTKRFLNLNLPELSRSEKEEIRSVWPGLHIYDMDFVNARVFKMIHGFSPYYLAPCWYNEMREYFNPRDQLYALENKAMTDVYFPEIKFPEVYLRGLNGKLFDKDMNCLSESKAIEILRGTDGFVIKPSIGSLQGKGVKRVSATNASSLSALLKDAGKNFVVQSVVNQTPEIKKFNPGSLNCFRVTTILFNGKFDYSSVLKIGKEGSVIDNWNSAYWITVNKEGRLGKYGYDYNVNAVTHSDNGLLFEDTFITGFDHMIAHLERWHRGIFPNCCVIGWDVTIDENKEVIVIEANLCDPGTNIEQFVSGDFFRPFRDDMLSYLPKK